MKILTRIIAALVLLIFIATAISAVNVYRYGQRDEKRRTDAAIVLGAAAFGSDPSPVLRERINHAILLYEQGYVGAIIFTGGQGSTGHASEGEISAQYARENGIPEEAILVEDESTNTIENLENAHEIGVDQNMETFLIVSTPSHMKRVMGIVNDLGIEAYSSPTRTIQWINWFTKTRAFLREVFLYEIYVVEKTVSG